MKKVLAGPAQMRKVLNLVGSAKNLKSRRPSEAAVACNSTPEELHEVDRRASEGAAEAEEEEAAVAELREELGVECLALRGSEDLVRRLQANSKFQLGLLAKRGEEVDRLRGELACMCDESERRAAERQELLGAARAEHRASAEHYADVEEHTWRLQREAASRLAALEEYAASMLPERRWRSEGFEGECGHPCGLLGAPGPTTTGRTSGLNGNGVEELFHHDCASGGSTGGLLDESCSEHLNPALLEYSSAEISNQEKTGGWHAALAELASRLPPERGGQARCMDPALDDLGFKLPSMGRHHCGLTIPRTMSPRSKVEPAPEPSHEAALDSAGSRSKAQAGSTENGLVRERCEETSFLERPRTELFSREGFLEEGAGALCSEYCAEDSHGDEPHVLAACQARLSWWMGEEVSAVVGLRAALTEERAESKACSANVRRKDTEIDALLLWRTWLRSRLDGEEERVEELETALQEARSEAAASRCQASAPAPALRGQATDVAHCHEELQENRFAQACFNEELHLQRAEISELCAALRESRAEAEAQRVATAESLAISERRRTQACLQMSLPTILPDELERVTSGFSVTLGTGAFGTVFAGKVCRTSMGSPEGSGQFGDAGEEKVAVKVAGHEAAHVEEQFLREVRAGGIRDPHLVPLLAVCVERRALVYPRACATLEDRLRDPNFERQPGPTEGLRFLLGAARGLLALHERDLVHRDVKSANVLLFPVPDGDGATTQIARLGDCGWAGVGLPMATELVGTAPYMDPEAWASGQCSKSSDVFSFGVCALEVLLRRSVTARDRDSRPLWRQLNEALPRVDDGPAAIAAAAVAFVRGALGRHGRQSLTPSGRSPRLIAVDDGAEDWQAAALEGVAMVAVDALKESITQPRTVDRPTVASLVERLETAVGNQADGPRPAPLASSATDGQPSPEEPRLCTICFEEPIGVRLRPCCHSLMCATCAPSFVGWLCPLCRKQVEGFEVGTFHSTFVPAPWTA